MADLDPEVFSVPIRHDLLHSVVVSQLAARRSGTAATRNRAAVSGGGSKPYRQKGTGRARQGTTRAPQFSGGGVVFGPQPRSYAQRLPKKVRRGALRSALSLRNSEGALQVSDSLGIDEIKTKALAAKLAELGTPDVLIVTHERDRNLELSGRNLPTVNVLPVAGLNVYDVLARKNLLIMSDALPAVVERLR